MGVGGKDRMIMLVLRNIGCEAVIYLVIYCLFNDTLSSLDHNIEL
jgi:hypothetical protein